MPVRVKRRYDPEGRRRQAEATGQRILRAALKLFAERGYAGTTIAALARAARVDPDTVFERFGSKPKLLEAALLQGEAAGGDLLANALEAATPRGMIDTIVRRHLVLARQLAAVIAAVREGAATSLELRAVVAAGERRRLASARRWITALRGLGALRRDISVDASAEIAWLLLSAHTYVQLAVERRWSEDRYREWLKDTLARLLLSERARA